MITFLCCKYINKATTSRNKVLTEQVRKLTSQTDLQAQLLKEKDKAIEVRNEKGRERGHILKKDKC